MDSLKASAASWHDLAAARQIRIDSVSPLAAASRAGGGPAAPAALPANLEEALRIAAQPEALVRLQIMLPDTAEVATVGMVVREGRAVHFTIDGGMVELHPPVGLDTVADSLAQEATYAGPLAGQEAYFWPSTLKLLSVLWQESQDPAQPLSLAATAKRLAATGSPAEVEKAVGELVRVGLVVAEGDTLRVAPPVQPWLALVWSGHAVQVEYLALPAGSTFEKALGGTGEIVLFVGPPGQRILNVRLTGDVLRQHTQGGTPVEDAIVRVSAPPAELVRVALGLVLRLQPASVA